MAAGSRLAPTTLEEQALWSAGRRFVAGVDEVGRGPIAGPVFAAAVVLHPFREYDWLCDVRDSKIVPAPERDRLAALIRRDVVSFGIGYATVGEIDGWGISFANRMAMERALLALNVRASYVLIDGPSGLKSTHPQKPIVDGDATCASIAAASIVAKVARDGVMCELDSHFPNYGFAGHKGYATRDHLERLARFGPCDQHRRSWPRVRLAGLGQPRAEEEDDDNAKG
jgi:ribonuclease HII